MQGAGDVTPRDGPGRGGGEGAPENGNSVGRAPGQEGPGLQPETKSGWRQRAGEAGRDRANQGHGEDVSLPSGQHEAMERFWLGGHRNRLAKKVTLL